MAAGPRTPLPRPAGGAGAGPVAVAVAVVAPAAASACCQRSGGGRSSGGPCPATRLAAWSLRASLRTGGVAGTCCASSGLVLASAAVLRPELHPKEGSVPRERCRRGGLGLVSATLKPDPCRRNGLALALATLKPDPYHRNGLALALATLKPEPNLRNGLALALATLKRDPCRRNGLALALATLKRDPYHRNGLALALATLKPDPYHRDGPALATATLSSKDACRYEGSSTSPLPIKPRRLSTTAFTQTRCSVVTKIRQAACPSPAGLVSSQSLSLKLTANSPRN